ncbi:PLDc N-terminal domain-containing protein [Ectothiorhodospira marina]|uniref:Phospholipase_D-nuclease N-terminal n=1 Tax=Ectothiorhodospira marina TaxID=1396821 RepID=A0A1H7MHG4_9GAMM|nr:PLDc N-terminal domain-containing protein [Ectothiorhodospira marina]SEL10067.1 Phospholipase_D-nuclease N-terminal [Ectothiorhodospira marina]
MGIEVGGLLGLVLLIAVIWAIVSTVQSRAGTGTKVLWIVLIVLLPLLGFILWLLLGPKAGR